MSDVTLTLPREHAQTLLDTVPPPGWRADFTPAQTAFIAALEASLTPEEDE